jgi:hypothetical protein
MALDIDAFAVLRSIGAHRDTFSGIAAEAAKAARMLVAKQIGAKNIELRSVRKVREVIGPETFNLILDGIPDAQVKTLVGKLDKHHSELKTSSAQWRREHLRALVASSIEPAVKPPSSPKRKKEAKPSKNETSGPELISYLSAGAKRKRQ